MGKRKFNWKGKNRYTSHVITRSPKVTCTFQTQFLKLSCSYNRTLDIWNIKFVLRKKLCRVISTCSLKTSSFHILGVVLHHFGIFGLGSFCPSMIRGSKKISTSSWCGWHISKWMLKTEFTNFELLSIIWKWKEFDWLKQEKYGNNLKQNRLRKIDNKSTTEMA